MTPTFSCPSTNGLEMSGEKYGVPFAVIVARSEPQIPLIRVAIFTHRGPGSSGSGSSVRRMHAVGPVYSAGHRFPNRRVVSQRGMLFTYWIACVAEFLQGV